MLLFFSKTYTINRTDKEVYENNDIGLKIYTDINNDIKNPNVKERKNTKFRKFKKREIL